MEATEICDFHTGVFFFFSFFVPRVSLKRYKVKMYNIPRTRYVCLSFVKSSFRLSRTCENLCNSNDLHAICMRLATCNV